VSAHFRGPLRPRARLAILVIGVLALCAVGSAIGYRVLRNSSLFEVHEVVVSGADRSLTSQVETTVHSAIGGRSLLAVSPGSLVRAVEAVPGVHVARVDRDFPSTLRVRVWPEHPVAIAVSGHDRVLVSSTGRVLATIGRRSRPPDLPRVGLPGHGVPHPGAYIRNPQVLTQIAAAASIPDHFGAMVGWVRTDPARGLYMQIHWPSLQIRLGPSVDLREKLRAAALVLRAYPTLTTREELTYIDVSAPSRPAVLPRTPDPATSSLVPETSSSDTATTSDGGATTDSTASTDSTAATDSTDSNATTDATATTTADSTATTATTTPTATTSTSTTP
jgi:cell division septal protein FtsQ